MSTESGKTDGASTPAIEPAVEAILKRGIAAVEKEDYQQGFQILSGIYTLNSDDPVDGLSHYGVCVALLHKKHKEGLRLCHRAIDIQFYNSVHYANTTKVYLNLGNRKKAVAILDQGLERLPKDQVLMDLRERIGWRRGNPIPFLHRDNFLNMYMGKRRAKSRRENEFEEPKSKKPLFWIAFPIGLAVYIAFVLWVYFSIAE